MKNSTVTYTVVQMKGGKLRYRGHFVRREAADSHRITLQRNFPDGVFAVVDRTSMTTYRLANGELVYGEYNFVMDLDFLEGLDEVTEVLEEVWELKGVRTLRLPERLVELERQAAVEDAEEGAREGPSG